MGDMIRRSTTGKPSIQKERGNNWTAAKRAAFLDHLAATCNVRKSCEAVGMKPPMAYKLRRREPAFAEQWRAALLTGYDRLEAALLEHAMRAVTETEHGEVPEAAFDATMAMALIKMHDARRVGLKGPGGPRVRRATQDETDAAILKQLAALGRRAKVGQA